VTNATSGISTDVGSRNQRLSRLLETPMNELPDLTLVELARKRDEGAIEALMRRYNRRLFRVARSVLRDESAAEDAVQEALIRAFMNLERYEPTGSFGAWLTRIALNEALMLRRRVRPNTVSLDAMDEAALQREQAPVLDESVAFDSIDAGLARQLLEQAVDALPEVFRTVFVMRVVEQLSINETAASLELKQSTVKTRLHRAHRRLRADLTRRLRTEQINLFDFAGARCDRIVAAVRARLLALPRPAP
jgi:RNA polymerase sigma-70 factor (ECF subfamily)